MATQNKTQPTSADVEAFLNTIDDEAKRADCRAIAALMGEITGEPAVMWGEAIVGFGKYHYRYASKREGDSFWAGFSPRKQNITLYLMGNYENMPDLMAQLGKYKTGKSCLYIKRLADVNQGVLRGVIEHSVDALKQLYPPE